MDVSRLKIIRYPDPRLRTVSEPVEAFNADLSALAGRMFELMREAKGVGLAAAQVGVNVRMFVMNPTGEAGDDRVIVNPRLSEAAGSETDDEGCLSLPGITAAVERSREMTLRAQDLTGQHFEEVETGYVARIWQHETDHLDGILFTDRLGFVGKSAVRKKLKAMREEKVES